MTPLPTATPMGEPSTSSMGPSQSSQQVTSTAPVSPTLSNSSGDAGDKSRSSGSLGRRSSIPRPKLIGSSSRRNSILKTKSKLTSPKSEEFDVDAITPVAEAEPSTPRSPAQESHTEEMVVVAPPAAEPASWIDAREGYQLMAMRLWRNFQRDHFFSTAADETGAELPSGVAIRYGKGQYVVCPSGDERLDEFCHSVAVLNIEAAMTLTSSTVAAITTRLAPTTTHVPITSSQHIQVVERMTQLAGARKAQNACFIRSENTLVVWADQVEILHERAKDLEENMMKFVWNSSYYGNSNNLMAAMANGATTPALLSPTVTSPTTSSPPSMPATPTSPFSSVSSATLFTALNPSDSAKTGRNHQRSYTKDRSSWSRQSIVSTLHAAFSDADDKGKEVVDDDIYTVPASPVSPARAAMRAQGRARHVSFSGHATALEAQYFDQAFISNDQTSSSFRASEATKISSWPDQSTVPINFGSRTASTRSSISSSDDKDKEWVARNGSIDDDIDEEKQNVTYEKRTLSYIAPLHHGLAVALDIVICFLFISKLFQHCLLDGDWRRMALSLVTILVFPVILFFCDNCIGIFMQLIGPVNQLHQNSLYYSGKAPAKKLEGELPHITIQMPVYKESLQTVLMPTIESIKKAITTYELQGGTAGIVVSEDGMLLVDEQEQKIRKEFYERNNVGWVARPGHNVDGYVRKGRFKKASNLNFTCFLSQAVEKMMQEARPRTVAELEKFKSDPRYLKVATVPEPATEEIKDAEKQDAAKQADTTEIKVKSDEAVVEEVEEEDNSPLLTPDEWTDADDTELYRRCLETCLPRQHRLAQAKGNIRIGQLVLMIDSDTRVPEDCFLDAATEMMQCPDVGVLQHCSGVMLVSDSYFELCIAFFTRLVNFAISFTVANGDVAPFMGHNAFLRWSAMQEASFIDEDDGVRKMWSESHVSEDFDMALRLLMSGYITRWATYSNNGFEEGVSLTCDDELNRWQKYAFGCSELVLHRLWQWPYKGIFTPLFKTFLWSKDAPIHYKFSACSYIFSYYAIGAAFPTTFVLYFIEGWFYPVLDPAFLTPFKIWLSVMVVFTFGGNFGQILARYRAKQGSLGALLIEHAKWMPCLSIFFGGLSFHVATALFAHPLGIDMSWGATNKDLEESNFFTEVPLIWKRFWKVFLLCWTSIGIVIVMQISPGIVPLNWSIESFFTYWPMLFTAINHMVYPIILNPALLRFSF